MKYSIFSPSLVAIGCIPGYLIFRYYPDVAFGILLPLGILYLIGTSLETSYIKTLEGLIDAGKYLLVIFSLLYIMWAAEPFGMESMLETAVGYTVALTSIHAPIHSEMNAALKG